MSSDLPKFLCDKPRIKNFFRFNYENISNSKTNFDLSNRFELIFKIFKVKDINGLNLEISKIKKEAKLEDNLSKLNIDVKKNSKEIMNGINILRMSNNPVEVTRDKIIKIITGN